MAQNPPAGVVCSAGVVEAYCCLVSLIQLPVTAIGTLKVALKSRTVDLYQDRPAGSENRSLTTRQLRLRGFATPTPYATLACLVSTAIQTGQHMESQS